MGFYASGYNKSCMLSINMKSNLDVVNLFIVNLSPHTR